MSGPLSRLTLLLLLPFLVFQMALRDAAGLPDLLGMVSGQRMHRDVETLADEAYDGRQAGTAADAASAAFVAARFSTLGLRVLEGGTGLTVPVYRIADEPRLILDAQGQATSARLSDDYLPIFDSPSVHLTAPLVFVGYGIADPARRYDEYEGMDVRNKIVLFLRGKPDGYPGVASHADKERTARERGAVGFLTATGPILTAYEARRDPNPAPKAFYTLAHDARPLPGAWISTRVAEMLLASHGPSLRDLQAQLNRLVPQSRSTPVTLTMAWTSVQTSGTLANVVGWLPARDGSDSHIIVGAHRDHFGRQGGILFPGADDNASGTAVLLEVARVLTTAGIAGRHGMLFVSFSGEEQGLLGSRRYVTASSLPLHAARGMINIDHAGVGNGRLTIGVTGLTKDLAHQAAAAAGVGPQADVFGFFPGGDHVPFTEAGIPTVTVVSGGVHPHFHRPGDTADTVRPEILELAARYVLAVVQQLRGDEPRLGNVQEGRLDVGQGR